MKIHIKILVAIVLLLSMNLANMAPSSEVANAAYDYTNLSCTQEQGRDIVFVIQDTEDMQKHDPEQSRVTEVSKLMDAAESQDRFGLIGFNVDVTKEQGLTSNVLQAKNVLNTFGKNISTVMGNDLSVGLERAVDELTKNSTSNDKIIIVMTVGNAINNQTSLELAAKAYEEDITIHTISFGDPFTVDALTLTSISDLTGGNYTHSPNASFLNDVLFNLNQPAKNFSGREVFSDWTLKQDVVESGGLLIHENVKVDLNGYDLTVNGNLELQSCAELRAVSGVITAKNMNQHSRSSVRLNNSQLNVTNEFVQDGNVIINGAYSVSGKTGAPEIKANSYNQKIHGFLNVAGQNVEIASNLMQEGQIDLAKGILAVRGNVHQKGNFNVQEGTLEIGGNLTINGGPLIDEAFIENRSLNVGGGVVRVGLDDGIGQTGNVKQLSGQLFVNHGTVEIFGDYSIADGWLTMIKGSMDTTAADYGPGDGDYVHVHGNFSMESKRNHAKLEYSQLGKPLNDQGHLTDGVLQVDGNFTQIGNLQYHALYSDRSQNYTKAYSRSNFTATGRHKVLLTGKGNVNVQGTGFQFNLLEVQGRITDYKLSGPVKYDHVIERSVSSNANLVSLSINDIPVTGFSADKLISTVVVPAASFTAGNFTLKVDARADDYLNAKVQVLNSVVNTDGTSVVKILVTAHDGSTKTYTVNVTVGAGSNGQVTSVELDREELLFTVDGANFKPSRATIGHNIYPKNAENQKVTWSSTNTSVATVNQSGIVTPIGVGVASIIVTTDDGKFMDAVTVKVLKQVDLLEGIKTLADLVSDNDRYNKITSGLYNMNNIGIVVPGTYIQSIDFGSVAINGNLAIGTIKTVGTSTPLVDRMEVRVNGQQLGAVTISDNNEFLFTRAGMNINDYIEVIAYDSTGNELERVSSSYPVNFKAGNPVPPGFYSLQRLLTDPVTFNLILNHYSPEQLRFAY